MSKEQMLMHFLIDQYCMSAYHIYSMLQGDFVRVSKKDLDKLTTEVMQLREFLPRVLNRDLIEVLHKARAAQTSIYTSHHYCHLRQRWTWQLTFMSVGSQSNSKSSEPCLVCNLVSLLPIKTL